MTDWKSFLKGAWFISNERIFTNYTDYMSFRAVFGEESRSMW